MTLALSATAALGAAMTFALAAILQQEAAQTVSAGKSLRLGLLADLVRRPKWRAGVTVLVGGYVLQLVALAHGPVALVQPIVITELAFAIPVAIWRRRRPAGRREWLGIACVLVGVSMFLLVASPRSGAARSGGSEWVIVMALVIGVMAVALGFSRRAVGPARAMLLGAAAGVSFGVLAALTKATTHLLGHDAGLLIRSWQPYGVVGFGVLALVLSQSAYQAGPLAYSMPLVGVLEPAVAVVIGATVLGEQVQFSGVAFAFEILAAMVASAGIGLLATSPTVLSIHQEAPG